MTNVSALKALYTAQGGSADLSNVNDIVGVLNAISGLLGGATNATTNARDKQLKYGKRGTTNRKCR